jgi:hypothetical protein
MFLLAAFVSTLLNYKHKLEQTNATITANGSPDKYISSSTVSLLEPVSRVNKSVEHNSRICVMCLEIHQSI